MIKNKDFYKKKNMEIGLFLNFISVELKLEMKSAAFNKYLKKFL